MTTPKSHKSISCILHVLHELSVGSAYHSCSGTLVLEVLNSTRVSMTGAAWEMEFGKSHDGSHGSCLEVMYSIGQSLSHPIPHF